MFSRSPGFGGNDLLGLGDLRGGRSVSDSRHDEIGDDGDELRVGVKCNDDLTDREQRVE